MTTFLTGAGLAIGLAALTLLALEAFTVSTPERYSDTSVILHDAQPHGEGPAR